jgi:hypothetical protein
MKKIFLFLVMWLVVCLSLIQICEGQDCPNQNCGKVNRDRCMQPQLNKVCSVVLKTASSYIETTDEIANTRHIEANEIPDHPVGIFPIYNDNGAPYCGACHRPNAITAQVFDKTLPLVCGTRGTTITRLELGDDFGIALNGVLFDPFANEWWNDDASSGWEKNAMLHPDMALDADCNNAHVQPNGKYHYHGLPTGLYEAHGGTYPWNDEGVFKARAKTVQLGWAFDGTPVYGPLCYLPDGVVRNWWKPKSGWVLKTGPRADAWPAGPGGYYNGDYERDFKFCGNDSTLDECNGHFWPTPEYPDGVYHQHITEEYPYIPRCYLDTLTAKSSAKTTVMSALLNQNMPNPFNHTTTISYGLPESYSSAKIIIKDLMGKVLKQVTVSGHGKGSVTVDAFSLTAGAYQYSLYVDGKIISTKQMLVTK